MNRRNAVIAIVIALGTVLVFSPLLTAEFINFDDPDYVTDNFMVRQGLSLKGVRWALTTFHASNWHPLTWFSHMFDVELFGLRPAGHHAVSVAIHALNAVLLFLLLEGMTGSVFNSVFAAALFALHPLRVESVAWIAERKDVLAGLFFMLTLFAYLRYTRSPSLKRYLTVSMVFLLGLAVKPTLVTLPVVLLLLDIWPLSRIHPEKLSFQSERTNASRLILEKIPLLGLSLISGIVTLLSQGTGGGIATVVNAPFSGRFKNALVSHLLYLAKMIWPVHLSPFYPYDGDAIPLVAAAAAGAALTAFAILALLMVRRFPFVTAGWFWFFIMLSPMIGIIKVGSQAMADRYTYLSMIGIAVLIAWGTDRIFHQGPFIRSRGIVAGAVLLALAAGTFSQSRRWHDSITLFSHAVALDPDTWLNRNCLGAALLNRGEIQSGLEHLHRAAAINPDSSQVHFNLGYGYQLMEDHRTAESEYRQALRLDPFDIMAMSNLARLLALRQEFTEAITLGRRALEVSRGTPSLYNNLGSLLAESGRLEEAVQQFREALRLEPGHIQARENLDRALQSLHETRRPLD